MNNLESKQMPFRTNNRFYQSAFKEKPVESIRVFPQKHNDTKEILFGSQPDSSNILKYLSGLGQARNLPRRVTNRDQFFPLVKICKRHRAKNLNHYKIQSQHENVQEVQATKKTRFQTFSSLHPSNRSIIVHSFVIQEEKKMDREKQEFRKARSALKEQKTKQMKFTFYNTLEKSEFFLKRFKEDTFLTERKTNNYQNMFKRTITSENILSLLSKSREKLKAGCLQ